MRMGEGGKVRAKKGCEFVCYAEAEGGCGGFGFFIWDPLNEATPCHVGNEPIQVVPSQVSTNQVP